MHALREEFLSEVAQSSGKTVEEIKQEIITNVTNRGFYQGSVGELYRSVRKPDEVTDGGLLVYRDAVLNHVMAGGEFINKHNIYSLSGGTEETRQAVEAARKNIEEKTIPSAPFLRLVDERIVNYLQEAFFEVVNTKSPTKGAETSAVEREAEDDLPLRHLIEEVRRAGLTLDADERIVFADEIFRASRDLNLSVQRGENLEGSSGLHTERASGSKTGSWVQGKR